jgi:N-acetylmuramoyl-L-alanine amidase
MERVIGLVKIFLDAGHGGNDSGAVGHGIQEKDIVLKIAKKMQTLLKNYENAEVIMSRDTDVFLSLAARTDKANKAKADVFLSLHCNSAAQNSARGFETYRFTKAGSSTIAFQNVLHDEIMKEIGSQKDRGKKQSNFHVLRESSMKAVLTENLFINNGADAALLKQDSFLDKIAAGHVSGLEKFLGLKRIEKPPQQKQPKEEKLYYVQVGAFEHKDNADALAALLRKEGYRPIVKYE